jgi:hypothetical protein
VFCWLSCAERLRAGEVCKAFRAALRESTFWHDLDLTGLPAPPSAAMLLAASARADGALRVLRLDGHDFEHLRPWRFDGHDKKGALTDAALAEVLRRNAASLREISLVGYLPKRSSSGSLAFLADVLASCPGLARLDASLDCTPVDACGVLLHISPALKSDALHLHELTVREHMPLGARLGRTHFPPGVHAVPLSGWRSPVPLDPVLASSLSLVHPATGEHAAFDVFLAALARADTRRLGESLTVNLTGKSYLFQSLVGTITTLSALRSLELSFNYRSSSRGYVLCGLESSSLPSFTKLIRESQLRTIIVSSAGLDMFRLGRSDAATFSDTVDAFVSAVEDNDTLEQFWMSGFDVEPNPRLVERLKDAWMKSGRPESGFRYCK